MIDIEYYYNGNIRCKSYYNENNEYHRDNGPAVIEYYAYNKGVIYSETYYNNGRLHREDGPVIIRYSIFGIIQSEQYFINGKSHRTYGPSDIFYDDNGDIIYTQYWYKGLLYTYEIIEWMNENNFDKEHMSKDNYDRMWMEIL